MKALGVENPAPMGFTVICVAWAFRQPSAMLRHSSGLPSAYLMEKAAENIIAGMKEQGVSRLIWATGAGVTAPQDEPTFIHRAISFLLKLLAPKVLENSLRGAALIKESDLDWTIVRAPMLTDDPDRGGFRISYVNSNMGRALSRENFAIFMLDMVESDEWIGEMPAASDK